MEFLTFALALGLGTVAAWQIFNWRYGKRLKNNKQQEIVLESHTLLERIEKVFKVVVAEGYFSEIYDHKSKKDVLGLGLYVNRKALVIAKAKVSMGYDFSKMKSHHDELTRKLVIDEFPAPEIISVDTDYKFYDINDGLINKFNTDEFTAILNEAKKLMVDKAYESDLPQIAQRQIQVMVKQIAASMNWDVDTNALPPIQPPKRLAESTGGFPPLLEE